MSLSIPTVLVTAALMLAPGLALADSAGVSDEAMVASEVRVLVQNDVAAWLSRGNHLVDWDKIEGAVTETSAPLYWREFDENEAAFTQKYVGGNVGITGRVYSVRSGGSGWVIDLVSSPSGIDDVTAELDLKEASYAATLRRGNDIRLICKAPTTGLTLSGCLSLADFTNSIGVEVRDETASFLSGTPADGLLLDPKIRHNLLFVGWAISHGYNPADGKHMLAMVQQDPRFKSFQRQHLF